MCCISWLLYIYHFNTNSIKGVCKDVALTNRLPCLDPTQRRESR